ncbi:endonuclease III [bacterium]|nr:endonuclease III [bacterium]
MSDIDISSRANKIYDILAKEFPSAKTALNFRNPLELLIATILSAQCTDKRVNEVTKDLFSRYHKAEDFANADLNELEEAIRPTGFFHNKANSIKRCCQQIIERHSGEIPDRMEDLVRLKGIGRKTANVIIGNAFGRPGIVVDTHVKRLSARLGLSKNRDPVKIEFDLMKLLPEGRWTFFSHLLINHGRKTCQARRPKCPSCCISNLCPSADL